MKTSFFALSLLTLTIATACDRRDEPDNAPTPDAAMTDASAIPPTDPTAAAPTNPDMDANAAATSPGGDDSLALGLMAAVDDHKIKAAQQALSKQVSAPVWSQPAWLVVRVGSRLSPG